MKVTGSKENGRWKKASKALRGRKKGSGNDDADSNQDLPWKGLGPSTIDTSKPTKEKTTILVTPKREHQHKNNKGEEGIETINVDPDKKNTKKLDEYGFIVNIDDKGALRDSDSVDIPGGAYTPSADTPKRNQRRVKPREKKQQAKLQRRREKKWLGMLQNWDSMVATKPKMRKLRQRIRKGIPNSVRGEAWTRIAGVKEKVEKTQKGAYAKLVSISCENIDSNVGLAFEPNQEVSVDNSVTRETIERDLYRTFPRHTMFYDQESDSSDDEYSDGSYDKLSSFDSASQESMGDEHCVPRPSAGLDSNETVPETHPENIPIPDPVTDPDPYTNGSTGSSGSYKNDTYESCLTKVTANCPPSIFTENKEVAFEPIKHQKTNNKKKVKVVDFSSAEGGQAKLRRVLRAYSIYDSEIGYCQGMNFIAGMFITFMDEEEAFWLLVSVMCDSPCRMRGLFSEGMSEAHQVLHVADRLIQQFYPRLARHFERQQIHITMFATQWLLTMYTSSFPFEVVTRVWDAYLSEGWKVAYRIMLALLERVQSLLMKMQFEEILNYFKDMPFEIDSNEVLELAFKIPLKKKHITKYAKEWEREQRRKQS